MNATLLVDTLIWTTVASTGGLFLLIIRDEGFFTRKSMLRKPTSSRAMAT